MRCRSDIELFARYFFPHHCRLPFCRLHRDIFASYRRHLCDDIHQRGGFSSVIAAPRGYAKSTLTTLILPIHAILYQQERYIVIVSATLKQAKQRLRNLKSELLTNKLLEQVYGALLPRSCTRKGAPKDWTAQSINVNGVQVDAFSAGTELRGITYCEFRPTRIILDDAEDSDAVESADQREKLAAWFSEVIENLGNRYTVLEVIGTLLHPESLLARLLKRPDVESRVYRAIVSFAEDAQGWNEWRGVLTDLKNPRRLKAAREFFDAHAQTMLKGAQVLWKEKEDYYELMCQMTTRGRRAFFKEKQNDPRSRESRVFDPQEFHYFDIVGGDLVVNKGEPAEQRVALESLSLFGFLDSALGAAKRSSRSASRDFAAIATVGKDRHGYRYVLDLWLKRVPPTEQIRALFDLHQRWGYQRFGIETNCFQQLLLLPLEEERERRKGRGERWDVPIAEVVHKQNKEGRILSLEPLIANGWILFNRALPEEFFQQCEEFPNGRHDDALDALEGALSLARQNRVNHAALPRRTSVSALEAF
jgi:predicted phage terminase large subunit-like protein